MKLSQVETQPQSSDATGPRKSWKQGGARPAGFCSQPVISQQEQEPKKKYPKCPSGSSNAFLKAGRRAQGQGLCLWVSSTAVIPGDTAQTGAAEVGSQHAALQHSDVHSTCRRPAASMRSQLQAQVLFLNKATYLYCVLTYIQPFCSVLVYRTRRVLARKKDTVTKKPGSPERCRYCFATSPFTRTAINRHQPASAAACRSRKAEL